MAKKRYGICSLTGEEGQLVKCHILPQAFTRPIIKGSPLEQSTLGRGVKRRWSSWYDPSLVTRAGEDILSLIDDKAITELRRAKLVWSGWSLVPPVFEVFSQVMPDHGLRELADIDANAISLFFWSVAWRASVSSLREMEGFSLPIEIEEAAKAAILSGGVNMWRYPISLTQLSTRGEDHNHTPVLDEKHIPEVDGGKAKKVPIARVYVDGLVAHLHFEPMESEQNQEKSIYLGNSNSLVVSAVKYETSFQYENLLNLMYESFTN